MAAKKVEPQFVEVKASVANQRGWRIFNFILDSTTFDHLAFVSRRDDDKDAGYQRNLSKQRAADIARYIDKENGCIPNSILVNLEEGATYDEQTQTLRIPNRPKAAWVIDGQHRMFGLRQASTKYDLVVTAFLGLDFAEQAKQFKIINSKQKGVPTSLLYDLLDLTKDGTYVQQRGHELATRLNDDPESPWYGQIDLTGSGDGLITQTRVVTAVENLISERGALFQYSEEEQYGILKNYFTGIKTVFASDWGSKNSVLTKALWILGVADRPSPSPNHLFAAFPELYSEVGSCRPGTDKNLRFRPSTTEVGQGIPGRIALRVLWLILLKAVSRSTSQRRALFSLPEHTVTFSDLEVAVSQSSRKHGYVRDNILSVWTPGAGRVQYVYSRELAGAILFEADEFFDRALMLFLLRNHLRNVQASTWAGVATYYANYFLALSFVRLHMSSVTHLSTGPVFEVTRIDDSVPSFKLRQRGQRQRHTDVWKAYYDVVTRMGWPDSATVSDLAPTLERLRFREQLFRERINYRPGEGFDEIYLSRSRYLKSINASLVDGGGSSLTLSDAAYADRMAAQRLKHVATLLHRLSDSRVDVDIEISLWRRRRDIVTRYAGSDADRAFASTLIAETD